MNNKDTELATASMIRLWESLSNSIAAGTPSKPSAKGELTIIGSGIAHGDFTLNDEARIRRADRVFYCTNDRVTQTWIKRMRPDALDLRILYDTGKNRYRTYVQMAEALLHCVRMGESVLAIYYGHPGIFATPAHRAIEVARREGYRAVMRPGISALDYLVADVGFDPMIPGLQSFDASDLLVGRRRIDPTLHIVLWQVGMVGEYEFSASGFENKSFDPFVGLLEQVYGPDWELIHYIAPQYAGVEPLLDRHSIASLREEHVRSRVSWLSTFYIPPRDVQADHAAYGPHELAALESFAHFSAPSHYRAHAPSPAADLMLAISRDIELEDRYRPDPEAFLTTADVRGLSDRALKLLAIPHPLAISAAFGEPPAIAGEDEPDRASADFN